ncbi:MAG: hypothetical protein N2109_00685 [Fimbriimonadales bacterium]|nr:hypothetical protein [Fimbriimonadales bacterium]
MSASTLSPARSRPQVAKEVPWGSFHKAGAVCLAAAVLPLLVAWPGVNGMIRNAAIAAGTAWLVVAWSRLQAPLRMPGALIGVLLLQVWSGVSTMVAAATIGRIQPLGTIDFFLMRHVFVFFCASVLVWLAPRWRQGFQSAVVFALGVVAAAGLADFLAPAAWAPVRQAMHAAVIDRPVGLSGYHSHLALLCNIGIGLLAGKAWFRRLRWWDFLLFGLMAFASLAAQARAHVPGLAVVVAAYLVGLFVRDRRRGFWVAGGVLAALLAALAVFPHQFQTLLQTDVRSEPTLLGRKALAWPQVDFVLEHLPWTGLGPEPVFWGAVEGGTDKWAPYHAIDAGFLLLAACYGYVGLGIAILTFLSYALGLVRVLLTERGTPTIRSELALAQMVALAASLIAMYANNIVTWDDAMSLLFLFGGLSQLSRVEERVGRQRPQEASCTP